MKYFRSGTVDVCPYCIADCTTGFLQFPRVFGCGTVLDGCQGGWKLGVRGDVCVVKTQSVRIAELEAENERLKAMLLTGEELLAVVDGDLIGMPEDYDFDNDLVEIALPKLDQQAAEAE